MVFVGDCGHQFHCVDAETGKPYWTEDVKGEVWGSALVADGRVYLGTRRGDLWTFAASKDKKVLATVHLGDPISWNSGCGQRHALHCDALSALRLAGRQVKSEIRHGSNQGNTSAGRNPVGNALCGVPLAPERHGGRSLQCYHDGKQIEPCPKFPIKRAWPLTRRELFVTLPALAAHFTNNEVLIGLRVRMTRRSVFAGHVLPRLGKS